MPSLDFARDALLHLSWRQAPALGRQTSGDIIDRGRLDGRNRA
jgi:hypothetical protein